MAKLFTDSEQENIKNLVKNFEDKTYSELLIILEKRSDPYPGASLRFGVFSSLLMTFILTLLMEFQFDFMIPLVFLLLLFPFSFIGRLGFLQRPFLTEKEMAREVKEKALETFFLMGPNKAGHRATSMIYFSLLEKKVHVLSDKMICDKFENGDLKKVVEVIKEEFTQKNYYQGLEIGVETLERLILYYFPEKVLKERPFDLEDEALGQNRKAGEEKNDE